MSSIKQGLPTTTVVAETPPSDSMAHGSDHDDHEGHDHGFEWQGGLRIALVAVAASLVWFRVWEPFAHVSIIGTLPVR